MISGVDFVTLPSRDWEAAREFYEGTLGLEFGKQWGEMPAGEFEAGNLTVAVMQTDAFGLEFKPHALPIEFHVEDFEAAKAELESRGVKFRARRSTAASACRRSSRTPTATRWRSTTATRRARRTDGHLRLAHLRAAVAERRLARLGFLHFLRPEAATCTVS